MAKREAARRVGARGFKGWGGGGGGGGGDGGTAGEEGLPLLLPALNPAVSLKARQLRGINPELEGVVRALAALGDGGERRGKEGWLTVLTALMQVACNSSEAVQKHLVAVDTEANEAVKTSLDDFESGAAALGTAAGGGGGGAGSTAGASASGGGDSAYGAARQVS